VGRLPGNKGNHENTKEEKKGNRSGRLTPWPVLSLSFYPFPFLLLSSFRVFVILFRSPSWLRKLLE
jgi:hypothetical protein